jgi:hypothetical protein
MTPDCTMYMHCPASPLLNTMLPALKLRLAPALFANWRMSISLPFIPALARRTADLPSHNRHII